jgi:hypothetical protein
MLSELFLHVEHVCLHIFLLLSVWEKYGGTGGRKKF